MDSNKFLSVGPSDTVSYTAKLMKEKNAGAVLVIENGNLVGIFTERDALFRVISAERDPAKTLIQEVMTANPITIGANMQYGNALLTMHEHGFRHLPVINEQGPIGIISSRSAMDPDLEEFIWEERRRLHFKSTLLQG